MKTWSQQQKAIFDWFKNGLDSVVFRRPSGGTRRLKPHAIVRARAGTGKTTTIEAAVDYAPEKRILLAAFNKRIADELKRRGTRAQARTLHSVGLACVKTYWPDVPVNMDDNSRADDLTEQVCGPRVPDTIKRLISRLHTKGREIAPHAREIGDLTDIQYNFELEPDDEWHDLGFDNAFVEQKALEAMDAAASHKPTVTGIDGSDMIFLPCRNQWLRKSYDMVIVDEAQDMTMAQLEIAEGVSHGRIVIVGDDRQAIYAFRGADSGSLDRLKVKLDAMEFPLTVTYRCGKAIVECAQELVPDFEAAPGNPEGSIRFVRGEESIVKEAGPGDFVLSRLNAPIVGIAMKLLRSGKRARVAGKDIGAGLITLIRKLKARTMEEFVQRLAIWEERQVNRLILAKRERQVDSVRDRAAMLMELSEGVDSLQELATRIDSLFSDDGLGMKGVITCSSVHKAKGLEADRVFILRNTLRNHNEEEKNIQYVAITRAKNELVWVED